MIARYVQKTEHVLRTLVVVEVELAQKLRSLVQSTAIEQVAWLAVNRGADIILVFFRNVPLRRCQFPGFRQYILHQSCHTGIM